MTARIRTINLDRFAECLPGLAGLLMDAVDSGGSLGYWAPLGQPEALLYWREVMQGMVEESLALLVAEDAGEVVGTVQLVLSNRQNGSHRAEVRKLMVRTSHRGHGLGRALLSAAHVEAGYRGRTLLILDTRTGDVGEKLYESMGYTRAAQIPGYTIERDGTPHGTTFFYHVLP
ncbi:MAG: GNAT family N-acetyltransferase [Betaproteobacteria bacterium]|nr:GNAT family N-acetyltransferase [Betaproteobacteria bacterium]